MFNLFNAAIKIVKNFVAPKPAPKPVKPGVVATFKNVPANIQGSNVQVQRAASVSQGSNVQVQRAASAAQPAYSRPLQGNGATTFVNQQALRVQQQAAAVRQQQLAIAAQQAEVQRKLEVKRQKQSEFDRIKSEYKAKAEATVNGFKKGSKDSLLNKLTFGFAGEQSGRKFANKQLEVLYRDQNARYDKKLNDFLKWQTKYKSTLEKKKFGSQAEYDEYSKLAGQEAEFIKDLEYTRAASTGLAEGFGRQAELAGTSPVAKVGGWFNQNIVNGAPKNILGGIWRYSLGSGTQQTPSLVTAPARAMNTLTNLGRKKGDEIVDKDGKVTKYNGNAWEASFNQSNLNGRPAKTTFDNYALTKYKAMTGPNTIQKQADAFRVGGKSAAPKFDNKKFQQWKKQNEANLKKEWQAHEKQSQSAYSFANEWGLDPLSYGPGAAVKGFSKSKVATKVAEAAKGSFVGRGFSAVKSSKPVSWLGAEYMPYAKRKAAFIKAEVDDIKRKKPLIAADVDYWQANKHKIKAAEKLKTLEFAGKQLAELDDPTAGAFRRFMSKKDRTGALQELIRAEGDWSKVSKAENFSAADRARIGRVADTVRKNLDELRDKELKFGVDTPYRRNYLPQYRRNFSVKTMLDKNKTGVTDNQWWFTKMQEDQIVQSRGALTKSLAARQYYSQLARQDLPVLSRFRRGYEDIGENIRRIEDVNKHVKRTKWEQAMRPFNASTSAWKTAVLKLRPAWTVNNVAWNVPASVLSGGPGALVESAKMLRPRNFRKAMNDVPESVKADLTGELGSRGYTGKNWLKKADSKLNAGYTNIENFSRVAAFNAAKKQGLSDAEALKRVNKYMFDYKIRNFERPFKAISPFYAWNKGLAKAAVNMPVDRPLGAKAYNQLDQQQNQEFEREFETVVPQLKKLGYSDKEIAQIKLDQAKYFQGRLKIGGKYYTTPFNAMSEKGMVGLGFNPYMAALGEASLSVDSFNRKVRGGEGTLGTRIGTKFPQWDLGRKSVAAFNVATGKSKPKQGWVGKAGSEGYGMTKEKQGFDKSKTSYDRNLDPRAKLGQDFAAYFGVPRGMEFDKKDLVLRKALQKTSDEYFKLNTKDMAFDDAEKARQAVFKKYGVTADQFYKGVLSKYDTENTKKIKDLKESASVANKSLFDEYGRQPAGTRNMWAVNKLRELNASGYFDDNPFKKSFDWIKPEGVARADKQAAYKKAVASGDWSEYRSKYGTKSQKANMYAEAKRTGNWKAYERVYGRSAKAKARDYAVKTGDWTAYRKQYGVSKRETPYQFDGKYFKSAESMQRYKDGKFWERYAKASRSDRKQLLADNPQYNQRANWTDEQWSVWKAENKLKQLKKARTNSKFNSSYDTFLAKNNAGASKFLTVRNRDPRVAVKWR